jgi:hypothetical protein
MTGQPFDAAEPSQVAERGRKLRLKEKERLAALGALMDHRATRAWVHDLLTRAHVFETSFSANPHIVAFREGERNIGLQLLNDIMKTAPDAYSLMVKEANANE